MVGRPPRFKGARRQAGSRRQIQRLFRFRREADQAAVASHPGAVPRRERGDSGRRHRSGESGDGRCRPQPLRVADHAPLRHQRSFAARRQMAGGHCAVGVAHQDPGPPRHRSAATAVECGRAGSGAGVRGKSARSIARRSRRRARHHGPRSGLPYRRQGRRGRCDRQGGGYLGDLSARAAAPLGRGARQSRQARQTAQCRTDLDRQRHRIARDRQARHRTGQAAAGPEDIEDRGLGGRRFGLLCLRLCVGGTARPRRDPARRGVDRAPAAGSRSPSWSRSIRNRSASASTSTISANTSCHARSMLWSRIA